MRVLVVNAGSSSLKVRLLDAADSLSAELDLPAPEPGGENADLVRALARVGDVDAVGHRVVHGGDRFREAVVVDDAVTDRIDAFESCDDGVELVLVDDRLWRIEVMLAQQLVMRTEQPELHAARSGVDDEDPHSA